MVVMMTKQQFNSGSDNEAYQFMQSLLAEGNHSLSEILELLERRKEDIQLQLRSINDAIRVWRLIGGETEQQQTSSSSSFAPLTPLQKMNFPAASIEAIEQSNVTPYFNEQFLSGAVTASVTSNKENLLLKAKSNKPEAAALRAALRKEQAERILIFKLASEDRWHNTGQAVKVGERSFELSFDFTPWAKCEEKGCGRLLLPHKPSIKVWQTNPNTTQDGESLKYKTVCLRHATQWVQWIVVKETELDNFDFYEH